MTASRGLLRIRKFLEQTRPPVGVGWKTLPWLDFADLTRKIWLRPVARRSGAPIRSARKLFNQPDRLVDALVSIKLDVNWFTTLVGRTGYDQKAQEAWLRRTNLSP